jgi:hypothetical protein
VSLSADGSIVAIGAYINNNITGHVRVYQYDSTKTTAVADQTLANFGPIGWNRLGQDIDGENGGDRSGYSVSLSADGSIVAIGAYVHNISAGHVQVYQLPSTTSLLVLSDVSLNGIPTAPTAESGTNTTQLATTAFVTTAVSSVGVDPDTDLSLNARLSVGSDVSMNANVDIYGNLTITGDLSVFQTNQVEVVNTTINDYTLIITEDISLNGDLVASGTVYSTGFYSTSDYRIKNDIVPINDTSYNIDNIRPVFYNNTKAERPEFGVIAHEVQELFPFLVSGEKDGEQNQTVNYTGFMGLVINEVQGLKKHDQLNKEKIIKLQNQLDNVMTILNNNNLS